MAGRPTKLTHNFIKVAKGIIEDDINAIIFTDAELLDAINEKLPEKERIFKTTFENWKRKNKEDNKEIDMLGRQFLWLIKNALRKQKQHLFVKFREEPNQWQRWAWIIERKFNDWNIKQQHDLTSGGEKISGVAVTIQKPNET